METRDELEQRAIKLREHALSGRPDREKYAWQALSEMPHYDAVTTVLFWMKQDTKISQSFPTAFAAIPITAFVLYMVGRALGLSMPLGALIVVPIIPVLMTYMVTTNLRRKACNFLASYNDVRVVDALLQAAGAKPDESKRVFSSALTRLLPSLRHTDSALLSPRSRAILNESLLNTTDVEFIFSILSALEQVGDLNAIPYVELLASGHGKIGDVGPIRRAALDAIPAIRTVADRSNDSGQLLRPSELGERTDVLLRPAGTGVTEEQALLKPSSSESV